MAIEFNDNVQVNSPRATDNRYGKVVSGSTVPYASVAEANALITSSYRYKGLTVLVGTDEYWYESSTLDSGLVIKDQVSLTQTYFDK